MLAKVKQLSGAKSRNSDLLNLINVEQFSSLSGPDQANAINLAFLEPLEVYKLHELLAHILLEDTPIFLTVSEEHVQVVLANLNQSNASGPNNVPNWLLKEYSDILAFPITHILNASYREQWLPAIWKMANVPPLPKKKPVLDLKKDLKLISLTPCVSKVAEEFVVEDVVKPAVLDVIHGNQYGAIPKSSTTMALISMLHAWSLGTDGNGATVRTMLFDYRKAFNFIFYSARVGALIKLLLLVLCLKLSFSFQEEVVPAGFACYCVVVIAQAPHAYACVLKFFILVKTIWGSGKKKYTWNMVPPPTSIEREERKRRRSHQPYPVPAKQLTGRPT